MPRAKETVQEINKALASQCSQYRFEREGGKERGRKGRGENKKEGKGRGIQALGDGSLDCNNCSVYGRSVFNPTYSRSLCPRIRAAPLYPSTTKSDQREGKKRGGRGHIFCANSCSSRLFF